MNSSPHIGHALEFAQTDVIARFNRLLGKEVFLLTGADENSLKNVQAAEELGITTQHLCDINAELFKKLAKKIGLSFNGFLRSSNKKEHNPGVWKLWKLCEKAGDIYKKEYKGLYCIGCEVFYAKHELVNGLCPEHKTKPELVEEVNYFFRLSKYQTKLEKIIENDELKITPKERKNEVLSFIRQGLEDFSVSRSIKRARGWGVPVPDDNSQITYVWFDALGIYLTGIGFGKDEKEFKKWWPADIHVIGKGITRFHAIYWPAILLSARLELPKSLFVHGYITVDGQKMSKSLGNVIDPLELFKKYDVDTLRYYLLGLPSFEDGDFSEKNLVEKINNELVANIGNFIHRTLSLIWANFKGKVPEPKNYDENDKLIDKLIKNIAEKISVDIEKNELDKALKKITEFSAFCNQYFQKKEPWKTKDANCLYLSVNAVRTLAILLEPYIPFSVEKLWKQLNLRGNIHKQNWDSASKLAIQPNHEINKPEILFKKIEEKK